MKYNSVENAKQFIEEQIQWCKANRYGNFTIWSNGKELVGQLDDEKDIVNKMMCGELKAKGYRDFEVIFTVNREDVPWIEGELPEEIRFAGPLERKKVMELYSEATLLFPSYIETFGFPPAEARNIGTMILASSMPFTHEVLEGYKSVEYFDPFSVKELVKCMQSVLDGKVRPVLDDEYDTERENAYEKIVRVLCSD